MIFYQLLIQLFIDFDGQLFAVFVFIIPNDEVFFLTVYLVQQILRLYLREVFTNGFYDQRLI